MVQRLSIKEISKIPFRKSNSNNSLKYLSKLIIQNINQWKRQILISITWTIKLKEMMPNSQISLDSRDQEHLKLSSLLDQQIMLIRPIREALHQKQIMLPLLTRIKKWMLRNHHLIHIHMSQTNLPKLHIWRHQRNLLQSLDRNQELPRWEICQVILWEMEVPFKSITK